jgi:hypothetical protein
MVANRRVTEELAKTRRREKFPSTTSKDFSGPVLQGSRLFLEPLVI